MDRELLVLIFWASLFLIGMGITLDCLPISIMALIPAICSGVIFLFERWID